MRECRSVKIRILIYSISSVPTRQKEVLLSIIKKKYLKKPPYKLLISK